MSEMHRTLGQAYTIATGRLFCSFDDLYDISKQLLGRPVFTHEFASKETWAELRAALEEELTDAVMCANEPIIPSTNEGSEG